MEMTIPQAFELGCGMAHHGNHQGAVGIFKGILQHEPHNWDVMNRLGASLFEIKKHYEAFWWFWLARDACPRDPKILGNYAAALSQLGCPEKGIPDFERAIAHAEKQDAPLGVKALSYNNLGNTLERVGRYRDAEHALRKGIAYDPNDPFPYYNLGIVLMRLNRHREGMECLRKSIALQPQVEDSVSRLNSADAHYNLGIGHLLHGEFKDGWEHYEGRLLTSENEHPNLGLREDLKWKVGESIEGKRVLVHCEQGVGDAIMFMRFLPLLRDLGPAEIMLVAHRAVRHLFKFDGVRILNPGEKIVYRDSEEALGLDIKDTYDCWVAQMSLPLYLGIDSEDQFPRPYAPTIPVQKLHDWANAHDDSSLNVGVCWAGFFRHKNDRERSIPLKDFAALFDVPGVNFISVQQVRPEDTEHIAVIKERCPNVKFLDLTDFADTAAVLTHCDLVISADTSVAHMAGSLALPTWVFVPTHGTDWRWQLGERADSPWYPSMKLYRKIDDRPERGVASWRATIARAKRDLETRLVI